MANLLNQVKGLIQSGDIVEFLKKYPSPVSYLVAKAAPVVNQQYQNFKRSPIGQTNLVGAGPINYKPLKPAVAAVGQALQRFPSTAVNYNPKPNFVGINTGWAPINLSKQATGMIGENIRSYGQTAEKIGTGQKLNVWDYANMSDFVPGIGFGLGGMKQVAREGTEQIAKRAAMGLVDTLHANPARVKGLGVAFEGEVKTFLKELRSAADSKELIQGGKVKEFSSKVKGLVDQAEDLYHSGKIDAAISKSEEALGYIHERADLQHGPEFLRMTKQASDEAVESFKAQGAGKTKLEGLMNESLAQTAFRRRAGLKIEDVYKKTQELVNNLIHPNGTFRNIPPEKKVGIIDYLRTPDRVLKKIGLGAQADGLRAAWETYKIEIPKEVAKITEWANQAPSPESNQKIFDYLDGTLHESVLAPNELKVATEIKAYLKEWADKLRLPEDKRVREYISHIFEKGDIELEFDPEVAKMIADEIPGSVYDPFLQKRKGTEKQYLHDTWRALSAYVKRATRKFNMDPALKAVEEASAKLDLESTKYVQRLTSGINMQPREIDNLLDNFIKSTPVGYRFTARPTAYLSGKVRRWVYRGALGLNVGSAIRNLTQSVNTYSKLGERWTATGAFNFFRRVATGNLDELYQVGVLNDSFIDTRTITPVKRMAEQMDKGLFFFFDWAEKINRGIAYYGAKAKYLSHGVEELQAQKLAKDIVRDTQFTFGAVDTPVVLQSDVSKLLLQFQSFNLKQVEFLGEMLKNKEFLGLLRYSISSLAIVGLLGKTLGYDLKDFIPFSGALTGETKLGQTPPVQVAKGLIGSAVKAPDEYGNVPEGNFFQRLAQNKDITGALPAFIPGGVQARKTIQGLQSYNRGYSQTPAGNVRFPVSQSLSNILKSGVLGQYSTPEARAYFDKDRRPLSEKQSGIVKQSADRLKAYQEIIEKREQNAMIDKAKEVVRKTTQPVNFGDTYIYYDTASGEVKSLDTTFEPSKPELTGNELLDKQLISKFNGEVTKKKNIILDLYEQGQLTDDEAEKQLNDLASLKTKVSSGTKKAKKPKKVTVKKLPAVKLSKILSTKAPTIKIKKTPTLKVSKVKNIYPQTAAVTGIGGIKIAKGKVKLGSQTLGYV